MSRQAITCDTTLLLYLARVDQIDLIPTLFDSVYIPEQVILELDMGRILRSDIVNPRDLAWATLVSVPEVMIDALPPNRLGLGEQAVVAYAHAHHDFLAGLDDLHARHLAETLGLAVVGTLGILLRAKQASLIPIVRPLVDAVIAQGFHLAPDLYRDVLKLAGED